MLSVFDIIIRYKEALLTGLFVTMQLCAVIWLAGIVLGALIGYLGARFKNGVGVPSRAISFVLGGMLYWPID